MKISINSPVPVGEYNNGFGHAVGFIYSSLKKLGYDVSLDNPYADIQFHWQQPHNCKPVPGKYNILYFPWESTELRDRWLGIINQPDIDEVWTTSDWCEKILNDLPIEKPIYLYRHGIDHKWVPKKRLVENRPVKFLVVDCEANRKGWQEAFDAFVSAYGNQKDVATLTLKSRGVCMVRWHDEQRRVHKPTEYNNVNVILGTLPVDIMRKLYYDHDVIITPSYGEGFAFIPFQMIATGAPAIVTAEWADYRDYLGETALRSNYGRSKWPVEHPGDVCFPDQKHLKELIVDVTENYEHHSDLAMKNAVRLHKDYDWLKLTESSFSDLKERFKKI